jgi:hypothetical protein
MMAGISATGQALTDNREMGVHCKGFTFDFSGAKKELSEEGQLLTPIIKWLHSKSLRN